MPETIQSTAATVAALNAAILVDLEELQSRGFGHPDGQPIMNRVKVALQQVNDLAGTPAPEPDPVQVQLDRLADQVEGLHLAVVAALDSAAKS